MKGITDINQIAEMIAEAQPWHFPLLHLQVDNFTIRERISSGLEKNTIQIELYLQRVFSSMLGECQRTYKH